MKTVLDQTYDRRVVMHRDDSDGLERVVIEDTVEDGPLLRKNERIRKEGLMPRNHKLPAWGEGESVECVMAFRVHPDLWSRFQRENPILCQELVSKHEPTRLKAAARLRMMHPEWCITEAKR